MKALGPRSAVEYLVKTKVLDRMVPRALRSRLREGTLHGGGGTLGFRYGTSDASVFWQVFVREDYRDAIVSDPRVIVDCGANVGYASVYFATQFPNARIFAIEPDPANFAMLQRNVARFGERVTPIQQAVWSTDGGLRIDRGNGERGEWGIRVRPCAPGETPDVDAISITTLLARHGVEHIDLLKVDIEGAERDLFDHNTSGWLRSVQSIIIEVHDRACHDAFFSAVRADGFDATDLGHGMAVAHRA